MRTSTLAAPIATELLIAIAEGRLHVDLTSVFRDLLRKERARRFPANAAQCERIEKIVRDEATGTQCARALSGGFGGSTRT
jgi:hypothetical protein